VIMLLLEAGSDASATDQAGQTGLHRIVSVDTEKCGQPVPEIVRLLVGAGLSVDAVDIAGNTALGKVVFHGYRKETFTSIDALLESGADPTLKNHYGVSAHHLAGTLQGADRLRAHLAAKWPRWFR
jgi:ankyrin repeat protein